MTPKLSSRFSQIAPTRFLLFALVFILAVPILGFKLEWRYALLCGFDIAALIFLLSLISLFRHGSVAQIRARARLNDTNAIGHLFLTAIIALTMLITIASLLAEKTTQNPYSVGLIIGTLSNMWFFANSVFALHYAHLYYREQGQKDHGGLAFPDDNDPDYWDFIYFSFTLGMTFQTSDVTISGGHMRRIVLLQSTAAFIFNIGILAFVINTLGG